MSDAKPVTRRQRMLIRRALRIQERAKRLFEKAREAITLAMQNGLQVGNPVEIEVPAEDGSLTKEWFRVKNNFEGDVAFKRAYVSKYELEKVPKYQRPKTESVIPSEVEGSLEQ